MALVAISTSLLLFGSAALAQTENGNECSCFRTNGSSSGYFTQHRFYDFRNLTSDSSAPPLVADSTDAANAPPSSSYFSDTNFTADWSIQNWNNSFGRTSSPTSDASVFMVNSPSNVYIESNSSEPTSYLTFRTARLQDFQSVAEIDSTELNFKYMSVRLLARVIGAPGACAGMFTYLLPSDDPQSVQESDIEILTSGPQDVVQYTNQPSVDSSGNAITKATINSTNPGGNDWTQWTTYRLDWMPDQTSWYIDGESVANISFQNPKDPLGFNINMWSDGGSWTGNMSIHDEAFLQIQWIDMVFNTSGPYAGNARRDEAPSVAVLLERDGSQGCKTVCSVDNGVNVTGSPVLSHDGTTDAGSKTSAGSSTGSRTWLVAFIGFFVVLFEADVFGPS